MLSIIEPVLSSASAISIGWSAAIDEVLASDVTDMGIAVMRAIFITEVDTVALSFT